MTPGKSVLLVHWCILGHLAILNINITPPLTKHWHPSKFSCVFIWKNELESIVQYLLKFLKNRYKQQKYEFRITGKNFYLFIFSTQNSRLGIPKFLKANTCMSNGVLLFYGIAHKGLLLILVMVLKELTRSSLKYECIMLALIR